MGFVQYHEAAADLPDETRAFARIISSMAEEADAINAYEQRMVIEKDATVRAIMGNAQQEEFKHFGMELEFLLRAKPKWRTILHGILFKDGDIVALGSAAEKSAG